MEPLLGAALDELGAHLTTNFRAAGTVPAQAEDQLKAPVTALLRGAGEAFGLAVVARTEAAASELGVRPDIGVSVNDLLVGHVELKAPGKGARQRDFRDEHDKRQFKRLSDHPNLVYTDGNEWALYRDGSLVGTVVRASGDVRSDGSRAYSDDECRTLESLLRDFLLWAPMVPSTPKALAELVAPLTRLLREAVLAALASESSNLGRLAEEWRSIFFPDVVESNVLRADELPQPADEERMPPD